MADKTLTQLITNTQQLLYQQAGLNVQVYSQDNLAQKIQDAFDFIFGGCGEDIWWKRFGTFRRYTLDGTDGYTTTAVSDVFRSFDDIYRIFPEDNQNVPLETFSINRNPYDYTGSLARVYMYDPDNVIRVAPFEATGQITIVGRTRQADDFALDETVPFDHLALQYHAAWGFAVDDGPNPAMAEKFLQLFNARIRDLTKAQSNAPISLTATAEPYPTRWS